MSNQPDDEPDRDEPVKLDLDPEEALAALLAVDPDDQDNDEVEDDGN